MANEYLSKLMMMEFSEGLKLATNDIILYRVLVVEMDYDNDRPIYNAANVGLIMIKLIEIYRRLIEGRQVGILYHFTTSQRFGDILKSNKLKVNKADWEAAVSFSRSWEHFPEGAYVHFGADVRIAVDGDKLSNNYKITPVMGGSSGGDNYDSIWRGESESRVYVDVDHLFDRYVISVDFAVDRVEYADDSKYRDRIDTLRLAVRKKGIHSELSINKFKRPNL